MTTTLKKIGGSLAVIIPKAMAAGLAAGQTIEMVEHEGGILLSRPRTRVRRPIDQIVKELDGKAYARRNRELLNDAPVGKEVW